MSANRKSTKSNWIDPDDAPELTWDVVERAQVAIGGKVIREATGTLTRKYTAEELERRKQRKG